MKFSIRDLFLVTVIVALALGWWIDRRGIRQERDLWEYHAKGLAEMSAMGPIKVQFNGNSAIARRPDGGTFTRTWPEKNWWYDGGPYPSPLLQGDDSADLPIKKPNKWFR